MNDYKKQAMYFKALSDETRLQIAMMLTGGELCACRILEHFRITQPTLSYHMKMLCGCGIVQGRREGAWMIYSLNPECIAEMYSLLFELQNAKAGNRDICGCTDMA